LLRRLTAKTKLGNAYTGQPPQEIGPLCCRRGRRFSPPGHTVTAVPEPPLPPCARAVTLTSAAARGVARRRHCAAAYRHCAARSRTAVPASSSGRGGCRIIAGCGRRRDAAIRSGRNSSPSAPAKKTTARQNQTRQSGTRDGARNTARLATQARDSVVETEPSAAAHRFSKSVKSATAVSAPGSDLPKEHNRGRRNDQRWALYSPAL
jgi:hypothetical protein